MKQIGDIMFWNVIGFEYLILTFKHHQICWFLISLFKIKY